MTLIVWDIGIKKMKERKHYFSLIFGKEKYKIQQGSVQKAQLDLEFLQTCKKNVIPKFLRFKLANRQLSSSHVYICQKDC